LPIFEDTEPKSAALRFRRVSEILDDAAWLPPGRVQWHRSGSTYQYVFSIWIGFGDCRGTIPPLLFDALHFSAAGIGDECDLFPIMVEGSPEIREAAQWLRELQPLKLLE
jgi:hypothetical protein